MQIYPIQPSFTAGECVELAVQPRRRFSIAIYQQQHDEALTSLSGIIVTAAKDVTATLINGKYVFQSSGDSAPVSFDKDWMWPTITMKPHTPMLESGAYVAVAYEVSPSGEPLTDLGRRCSMHQPVFGCPPDSDNMALLIARPRTPSALIAYVVPTATYHAYNSTGGGCYYRDPIHRTLPALKVSLRRPGGGLGAQLGEPTDPYDPQSPRQQFTHWDAKFIRWLRVQNLACDFYTDLDLHRATDLNLANYRCMLSVGHHEYWSQEMRDQVARFIAGGGNLAVFSGNTCFRPIDFGPQTQHGDMKEMNRLRENWPDFNESDLIGLSYGYGGGKFGIWRRLRGGWIKRKRDPIGFTVQQENHWVFAGTGLKDGEVFGAEDHLVGYEVDGVPPIPNGFNTLANTRQLDGWEIGGIGALGIHQPELGAGSKQGLVFNCGTTDWARVLIDPNAKSHLVVAQITRNVIRKFLALDSHHASRQDSSAGDIAARTRGDCEALADLQGGDVMETESGGSPRAQTT
jgi:hypothetical protein